jgi:3-oxo-5alpha-steroid 4-dehydrogenase
MTAAIARYYERRVKRLEAAAAKPVFIRARHGICLSSGGFIFNKQMVAQFAPRFLEVYQLGTPADNGSGILLGRSVAGALHAMDRVSSWRFLNPPEAWSKGIVVNARGARYINESSYGAHLGRALMAPGNDGVAWLILDAELWNQAKESLKRDKIYAFQRIPAWLMMTFAGKKATSLEALGDKLGFDKAVFAATIEDYRRAKAGGIIDQFGKAPEDMGALRQGPFYAMDVGLRSRFMPLPTITLGGLLVDEESGLVLRDDGSTIPGLYAAGRTAIGLCSYEYLSGLSAGDCIFSGRRAGGHASGLNGAPEPSRQGVSGAAASESVKSPTALIA